MTFSPLDSRVTGPLFATAEMETVFSDRALLAAMLRSEVALALAQAEFGLVPAGLPDALASLSAADLDVEQIGRETRLAMVPTIPFVKAVRRRLPLGLQAAFHFGSTTQDILDTAFVLQIRDGLDLLVPELAAVIDGLMRLAERHARTPCVGRTYGQHAAPLTFGFKAAIWCAGIAEVAAGLPRLRERALTASCGGPVGTLAALGAEGPAIADRFAAELDLRSEPIAWHTRRARIVEIGLWTASLLGALAKMATDISDLVSTDVGEAAEPYEPCRGGSSAMPHKRNPVSTTVILAAHGAAGGHATTLLASMAAAHERPAGAWHAEWHALPQLFGLVSGAVREARALAEGLQVDPDRMRRNLDATRGLLFADAATSRLAPHLGREAALALVERSAEIVRGTGGHLRDVLSEDEAVRTAGAGPDLTGAFDLGPSIDAAALWTDRALADLRTTRRELAADGIT